jgi:hypothetical protein
VTFLTAVMVAAGKENAAVSTVAETDTSVDMHTAGTDAVKVALPLFVRVRLLPLASVNTLFSDHSATKLAVAVPYTVHLSAVVWEPLHMRHRETLPSK